MATALPRKPLLVLLALACGAYLTLAWFEQVPGGWRLRNLFEPHAEREAARRAAWRERRLAEFAAEVPPTGPLVAFFGSSTVERFPLAASFPGAPTLNRGVAFESSTALLDRLGVGVPRPLAGAVLYIGSIDHRFEEARPEDLMGAVQRIVGQLRAEHGDLALVLLGLLGERALSEQGKARLDRANEALAEAARLLGGRCVFIPTDRPPLSSEGGQLAEGLSTDSLHLSREGYQVLAGWILEEGGDVARLLRP